MQHPSSTGQQPRVVIVGAGFGGLAAAQALARTPARVLVIDRRNYHLFQPLLYQVATAALSPADIAWPIRGILGRPRNAAVQLGRVTGVDTTRRDVLIDERRIAYDYLILATGARHAYFGHEEWEVVAPGLKKIDDATLEAIPKSVYDNVPARPAPRWPARSRNWRARRWPPTSARSTRGLRACC